MNTLTIDKDGTKRYRDPEGRLHHDLGPAVIHPLGSQEWYWHGIRHRDDGPAIVHANGHVDYWVDGFHTYSSWNEKYDDLLPVKLAWDAMPEVGAEVSFQDFINNLGPYQLWSCTKNPKFPFSDSSYPFLMLGPDAVAVGEPFDDAVIRWEGLSKRTLQVRNALHVYTSVLSSLEAGAKALTEQPSTSVLVREFNEPFVLFCTDWRTVIGGDSIPSFLVPERITSLKLAWDPPTEVHEGPYKFKEMLRKLKPFQVWQTANPIMGYLTYLYIGSDATVQSSRGHVIINNASWETLPPSNRASGDIEESITNGGVAVWKKEEPYYLIADDWRDIATTASLRFDPETAVFSSVPDFGSTNEAFAYARDSMTVDQIPLLQQARDQYLETARNNTLGFDDRIKAATSAQFLREAIEEYQKLHPEQKTASIQKHAFDDEQFRWFSAIFDVAKAQKILEESPREPHTIKVDNWAPVLITHAKDEKGEPIRGPVPEGEDAVIPLVNVHIDWDHVKDVQLDKPGIIMPFNGTLLLIDGHHRLAKAWQEHVPDFQVCLLTEKEARSILKKPLKLKDAEQSSQNSSQSGASEERSSHNHGRIESESRQKSRQSVATEE